MNSKEYIFLTIPFIISTITQPLLGAVDTAVLGRLDDASFMGGVAIATVIFNTMYWLLGFLRVSTSGFAAQSLGNSLEEDKMNAYLRPFFLAGIISIAFIVLHPLILNVAVYLYDPAILVRVSVETYFNVLIWGAPFVLIGYVNIGWLMGRKLVKETLFVQVGTNVLNIVLDIVLVLVMKMGVLGVAYATLFSQFFGFMAGMIIIMGKLDYKKIAIIKDRLLDKAAMMKIISVNGDLLVRTVCLMIMTNMFVAKGSEFGENVLAANAVLFQIQYILAYFYDGIANSSSVFAGRALGGKKQKDYDDVMKVTNYATMTTTIVMTITMFFFVDDMILLFTNIASVINIAQIYSLWMILFPAVVGVGLVYYGVYTGCSVTRPVRNSMIFSLIVFVLTYVLLVPYYSNHGLWAAFIAFSLSRSLTLYLMRESVRSVITAE